MKKIFFFLAMLLCAGLTNAQNTCVVVNSINVNTGFNSQTNTQLPLGNQDPNWIISAMSPALTGIGGMGPLNTGGFAIQGDGAWTTPANTRYLSTNAQGGFTHANFNNNVFSATFRRTFRTCFADTITINLGIRCDNILLSWAVDGNTTLAPGGSGGWLAAFPVNIVQVLPAGLHTIDITIQNMTNLTGFTTIPNPFGLNVTGTVTSANSALVSEQVAQANCVCPPPPSNCSDTCYWEVTGNNIISGNNIFGTRTNDGIRIFSNNNQRGAISAAGAFGWQTNTPTTGFHVNCAVQNFQAPSGLRFENVPRGSGEQLMVDANGYVFRQRTLILEPALTSNCSQTNYLTKVGNPGVLECSQVFDNGSFVGINSTFAPVLNGTPALFYVNGLAAVNSLWSISDGKYKEQVKPIKNAMEIIRQLRGVTYKWNTTAFPDKKFDNGEQAGFIAQEVKDIFPMAVASDGKENYMMNYNAFIPLLTQGQQELAEQVQLLKEEVARLKNQIAASQNKEQSNGNEHQLWQNKPNPFNGSTTIECYVAAMRSNAFIAIYDLTGKELHRYRLAGKGKQQVLVQEGQLTSGMYVYALIVDGAEVESRKMLVMKE